MKSNLFLATVLLLASAYSLADVSDVDIRENGSQLDQYELTAAMVNNPFLCAFGQLDCSSPDPGLTRYQWWTWEIETAGVDRIQDAQRIARIFGSYETLPIVGVVPFETQFSVVLWEGRSFQVVSGPLTQTETDVPCYLAAYKEHRVLYCKTLGSVLVLD